VTSRYTYEVMFSAEEGDYIATCREFPDLSSLGDTHEEALAGIEFLVSDVIEELRHRGDPVPEPLTERLETA